MRSRVVRVVEKVQRVSASVRSWISRALRRLWRQSWRSSFSSKSLGLIIAALPMSLLRYTCRTSVTGSQVGKRSGLNWRFSLCSERLEASNEQNAI